MYSPIALGLTLVSWLTGCVSEEEQKRRDADLLTTEATAKSMLEDLNNDNCSITDTKDAAGTAFKIVECENNVTTATLDCAAPSARFTTVSRDTSISAYANLRFDAMPYAAQLFANPKVCGVTASSVIKANTIVDHEVPSTF